MGSDVIGPRCTILAISLYSRGMCARTVGSRRCLLVAFSQSMGSIVQRASMCLLGEAFAATAFQPRRACVHLCYCEYC